MVAKHETTSICAPTLARLQVRFSEESIETIQPNWLLLPYAKYGFLFQAQQVRLKMNRTATGLCDEGQEGPWPCTAYAGYVRGVVRSVELFSAIREYLGGGISEDIVAGMIGDPDVDLDGDGVPDGHSLQFDVDFTPVDYAAAKGVTP